MRTRTEIRDGMRIEWDVPIPMDDGIVLRADIFRPVADGRYPILLTYGPYAKGLAFQDGYPSAWERMVTQHPDVAAGSSNKYQNWEVVDPEKWVRHDYICVRVDSRGCGCSPGYIDHFSPRETKDFYDCIEWAGVQPWSNGKVGLNGISYYGINQWHVATLQPPHLHGAMRKCSDAAPCRALSAVISRAARPMSNRRRVASRNAEVFQIDLCASLKRQSSGPVAQRENQRRACREMKGIPSQRGREKMETRSVVIHARMCFTPAHRLHRLCERPHR